MEEPKRVSPVDSEKGGPHVVEPRRASVVGGTDHDLSSGREDDFMTRNGLNLKSFQRRECACSNPFLCLPWSLLYEREC